MTLQIFLPVPIIYFSIFARFLPILGLCIRNSDPLKFSGYISFKVQRYKLFHFYDNNVINHIENFRFLYFRKLYLEKYK
jgi:hypothetical protein